MVVLPELCSYGPRLVHAEAPGGAAERAYSAIAREHGIWLLPGSLFQ